MIPKYWERLRNSEMFRSLAVCINFDGLQGSLVTSKISTATGVVQEEVELDELNRCLLQCLLEGRPETCSLFSFVRLMNEMDRAVELLETCVDALTSSFGSQRELQAFGDGACLGTHRASSAAHRTVGEASSAEQQIVRATRLMQGDRIYNMVRSPRGKCIIINNRDFGGSMQTRHGSDVDVRCMKHLFRAFLFECEVHWNLKAKDMEEVLKAAAESEQLWSANCLVVVLMSHGDRDIVFGTDCKPLHLYDKVCPLFSNDNCPALQGKPKLFFVQACRGNKGDNGAYAWPTSADASPLGRYPEPELLSGTEAERQERMATFSDMYIVNATIPGYVALRDKVTGSWLFSAMYSVFSKHACSMHLEDMMHLVHEEVLKQNAHYGPRMTPCTELFGWTKHLFFNPGMIEEAVMPYHTS